MDEHDQHELKLLAHLHYVLGGLTAACALLALPFVWLFYRLFDEFEAALNQPALTPTFDIDTRGVLLIVALSASVLVATFCLVHGAVLVYIGRSIARRRRRWLCLVFSGLHLINIPYGTTLSIFALTVLLRPGIKQAFG